MRFNHIDYSHKYLENILSIIREGILRRHATLNKSKREVLNSQSLVEVFNIIGTTGKIWIGVQKEHEQETNMGKEDIYFHLNDDNCTCIFYVEAKRLPKYKTNKEEEYVVGKSSTGNPSGGIQRYKLEIHGSPYLQHNGMIAYVENKTIKDWLLIVNKKIENEYPQDSLLTSINTQYEYTSTHFYTNNEMKFKMHHFWIDLTNK
jgi:hypothetical protein